MRDYFKGFCRIATVIARARESICILTRFEHLFDFISVVFQLDRIIAVLLERIAAEILQGRRDGDVFACVSIVILHVCDGGISDIAVEISRGNKLAAIEDTFRCCLLGCICMVERFSFNKRDFFLAVAEAVRLNKVGVLRISEDDCVYRAVLVQTAQAGTDAVAVV